MMILSKSNFLHYLQHLMLTATYLEIIMLPFILKNPPMSWHDTIKMFVLGSSGDDINEYDLKLTV